MNTKEQRRIKAWINLTNLLNQTSIKSWTKKKTLETQRKWNIKQNKTKNGYFFVSSININLIISIFSAKII